MKKKSVSKTTLLELYSAILRPRLIEEKMLLLLRQGKISKWFSGIGQEAIAVGATMALRSDEYILPLHRNLGVFTSRNIPLEKLFAQLQGKAEGFTKARDRSFHFGSKDFHIVGMISHLGPQLCVADGIALADKLCKEKRVTLVFSGDGGTSEGDVHEAINVASVWNLPVIFLIENNGYGLSTPTHEQFRCERLSQRAEGYGIEGMTIDGNDLLTVYQTVQSLAVELRKNPRPIILECMTFRMRGHEEASGIKYVPKELLERWAKKDPVLRFERYLIREKILTKAKQNEIRKQLQGEIEEAVERAFSLPELEASIDKELGDVYQQFAFQETKPQSAKKTKRRYVDAISDALALAMRKDQSIILMGQDIAEYGGVFKVTEGFLKEFGRERVRNTPLCESAILGAALGASIRGLKSIVEMQFADFVTMGFNQIVNNLAKSHYRWGQNADVVIRMPSGAGTGAGPFHSQTNEAWFFHTPGLKVACPAFPNDAKGLLLTAIEDPNPVLFFEHKALYRSKEEEVFDDYFTIPFGQAKLLQEGEDVTIISWGLGVHWALETLGKHGQISADLLDLRTLVPLDYAAIQESVRKTSRALIVHEDTLMGGVGGEISAWIAEHCFQDLDAPVMRVASLDTPIPFASPLERQFLGKSRLEETLFRLLDF